MDELITWADIGKRLKGYGRGAQSAMARHMRIDPSYFSRRVKQRVDLTLSEARLASAWFEGEAPGLAEEPVQFEHAPRRLKVFGYAATSDGDRIAIASDRVLDTLELPAGMDLDPEEYFVILPIGSSMEPRIFAGEPQVVRRNYPPARDKKVLIEFTDGTALIKSYRGQKDGRVFAEQYNPPKVVDYDASSVKALHAITLSL